MRVLYDHQAFQMQYFGGVSKCFCELISALPREVDARISIVQSNNVHLWESGLVRNLQHVTMDHRTWNQQHPGRIMDILYLAANKLLPLPTADSLNRRATFKALKEQGFDVFHPTYFKPEFLDHLGHKPFVLTIHDMMPELFPDYYGSSYPDIRWKRQLVGKAAAIVAVSENTKQDIVRLLGVDERKIHVIYHGGPEASGAPSADGKRLVDGRYFLYVGQRNMYKNFDCMLKAFAAIASQIPDVRLVCTGPSLTASELSRIKSLSLTDRVVHVHPSDAEMQTLYNGAMAFVYPSLYEGFGMPILEAYANHCPCILNRASCFPEVSGDAALYFTDVQELSQRLLQVSGWSDAERDELIRKGHERLKLYSWRKSAQQLAQVYESVI